MMHKILHTKLYRLDNILLTMSITFISSINLQCEFGQSSAIKGSCKCWLIYTGLIYSFSPLVRGPKAIWRGANFIGVKWARAEAGILALPVVKLRKTTKSITILHQLNTNFLCKQYSTTPLCIDILHLPHFGWLV